MAIDSRQTAFYKGKPSDENHVNNAGDSHIFHFLQVYHKPTEIILEPTLSKKKLFQFRRIIHFDIHLTTNVLEVSHLYCCWWC